MLNSKHYYAKTKYGVTLYPPHTDHMIPCMRNPKIGVKDEYTDKNAHTCYSMYLKNYKTIQDENSGKY